MGRMIPKRTLEDIRFRTDVVDLIKSYLTLKPAGSGFKGLCPFHKEKTPSFHVNPQRQIFHCFGCGAGGDVFAFVMQREGMDFTDAAKMLADRSGVALELEEGDGDGLDKNVLYRLHSDAAAYYRRMLVESKGGAIARKYLEDRGLTGETMTEFMVGYAPKSWSAVLEGAQKKKYKIDQIEAAGLILKSSNPKAKSDYYDRFRNRVMFPICDAQGRVIGFSGRTLDENEKTAKYVNSPETPLFKKSRVLYALDKARRHIVEGKEAIICEGQIDVIRCHQAGLKMAVASQGTAFTEDHARILQRYADSICLAFDPDKAGQDASIRAATTFLAAGLAVRIAVLPKGEDADSFIQKNGGDAFRQLIKQAETAVGFQIRVLSERENRDSEVGLLRISKGVLDTVTHSPAAVQRAKLVQEAAELLNLPASALQDDLRKLMIRRDRTLQRTEARDQKAAPKQGGEHPKEEVVLCEHMVHVQDVPAIGGLVETYLPLEMVTDEICRTVIRSALEAAKKGRTFQEELNENEDTSGELQRFSSQVLMAPNKSVGRETCREDAVKGLILRLWARRLKRERDAIGADQDERRAQITYDLKALEKWEDGSAVIEIELSS